ncbi:MAG: ChpI protein [Acidobacteria bacterium]|nr:ChpI protein [Acidobacteriota bacterium]
MKTAVSIRDNVFKKAEDYAKKAKISRSKLYSDAVEEYLSKRSNDDLIARINAVCDVVDTSLDPVFEEYQRQNFMKEEW